ncbi:MAG: metallophosphoesterase [archaeon]
MIKENEILSNSKIIGLTLLLEKEKILVLGDLHLGFEESLNNDGILIPRFNYKELEKHLRKVFKKTMKLEKIIIIGDLKHEFGRISEQEWSEVLDLIELLSSKAKELILIQGNHDIILGPITNYRKLKLVEEYFLPEKKLLFLHGHKLEKSENYKKAKTIIIGHEHPAVVLKDGVKREKYKCFLKGKFEGKELIVLPSLNFVSEGTNVLNEKLLSPFLKELNLASFTAWIVMEGKVFYFEKLEDITNN